MPTAPGGVLSRVAGHRLIAGIAPGLVQRAPPRQQWAYGTASDATREAMLAEAASQIPEGPLSYEPKWDGFLTRLIADLALVWTKQPLPATISLAPENPVVGSKVMSAGFPLGGPLTTTRGKVCADYRRSHTGIGGTAPIDCVHNVNGKNT